MADFEKKLLAGLGKCGIDMNSVSAERPLGVAVSGGADSVSLLCALSKIFDALALRVITVNHNIRPQEESAGDADFVRALSERLRVPCKVVSLEAGMVSREAQKRGRGTEEAARFLRYKAFDLFCAEEHLCALCLAHNQNDEMETLLMRFLQGSGAEGGFGIAHRREQLVRPMLDISRAEIESYLRLLNQLWRTDLTNGDTAYLRNNIRRNIVPVLDAHVAGWKTALISGAEKAFDDHEALQSLADSFPWHKENGALWQDASVFFAQKRAVRRRMLFNAFDQISGGERMPYQIVRQVLGWAEEDEKSPRKERHVSANSIEVSLKIDKIYVKKCEKKATESGFLAIIKDERSSVRLMRSVQSGDCVRTKDGSMKSVQKVFSDWKVTAEDKNRIPLIQDLSLDGQPIVAILGSEYGYADWIVT